jgi:hypothetical protein
VSKSVNRDVNERPVGHNPGHARHDRLLVVRFAAGEAEGSDNEQARALVDQCRDCARLAADMTTLRSSMAALPTPKRTRDFQLTPEQAEQLRGSAFDRFLRRLAMPKLGLLRPVAGVAVALGITLFVVGAGLPASYLPAAGVTGGAPPPQMLENDVASPSEREGASSAQGSPLATNAYGAGGVDTAASPAGTAVPAAAPSASAKTGDETEYAMTDAPTAIPAPSATAAALVPAATATAAPPAAGPGEAADGADTARLLMVYGGVTLAVIAFGILLLSLYARRRTEDPLLR